VEFSPDGRYIVAACWDHTACIWSVTGEAIFPVLKNSGKHIIYAGFNKGGRQVVTANANGVVCLWDLASTALPPAPERFFYSKNGERYVTFNANQVQVLATLNDTHISKFQTSLPVDQVKLSHDGSRLLTVSFENLTSGSSKAVLQLWDGVAGKAISPLFRLAPSTSGVLLSDDGRLLVSRAGTNVFIWNSTNADLLVSLPHSGLVRGIGLSRDGSMLVTVSGMNKPPAAEAWRIESNWDEDIGETNVYVWQTSGKLHHKLSHSYPVAYAEFSPDGERLVTCNSDGTLFERTAQIWNVKTGAKIGPPLRHGDGVVHTAFSPDGKRILTTSEDTTVRVWDAETGRSLLPPLPHPKPTTEACFSPDGRWIASSCREVKAGRVWDAETGEPLTPPLKHPWPVWHVQFVPGGKALIVQRAFGESILWPLQADDHGLEYLAGLAQLLSGHQRDYTGGILPQEREALQDIWKQLEKERPADFTVSSSQISAWHQHEAEASEKAGLWSAALVHWDRLNEIEPGPLFEKRRNRAREKAGQQAGDEAR